ncbi:MAG: Dabb family protein [Planctomycetota bacterium]|nr:MAG: Dabb family protein [Planctomycetota bacterium]REK21684.1 MAG: Dabb family protein [Planctomycetota bacterium]REK32754.1 MAG: Dabb family protein [Planctomycetota bacterium]
MKTFRRFLPFFVCLTGVAMVMHTQPAAPEAKEKSDRVLRHVVLLKFKEDATEEQIREVEQGFAALPEKIDAIESFEWGTNNSPEMHSKGFTHCFLVTFRDEEGRAEYLPHEEHQAFVEILKPVLEDVLVVDYWTPAE